MTTVPEPAGPLAFAAWQAALPPDHPSTDLLARIRAHNQRGAKVVVLDDDPTGPQAISDVYVLADWSIASLARELAAPRPLFFVLANTRAMPVDRAVALHAEIAANLAEAARQSGQAYALVSRGDSTLRGHFPAEVDALGAFDGTIIAPFFLEGGRYTFDDVQWVREGDQLLPAAQTPYARDLAFGYRHSNLRNWIIEKTGGRAADTAIASIGIGLLRSGGPEAVTEQLLASRRPFTIVNAASYRDMEVFVAGLLAAEDSGRRYVCRTAASFVRVRAGQGEPLAAPAVGARPGGGLVLVGSHVPKTSAQLQRLLAELPVVPVELSVQAVAAGDSTREAARVTAHAADAMRQGRTAVVYTTRTVANLPPADSLALGARITETFIDIVRNLPLPPAFVVTKGGWTASEIGVRGFGVRRAYAPAPILPGVPMWLLGAETHFPAMPYVVFPGNVGGDDALLLAVRRLQAP